MANSDRQLSDSPILHDRYVVLVAADNAVMQRFISTALSDGCHVVHCSDGAEALKKATAAPPDLLVADLMMPKLDRLVAEMRAGGPLRQVPVLVLATGADEPLLVKLLAEQVQDYVIQPFLAQELRVQVLNLVMMKRSRDLLQKELASQSEDLTELTQLLVTGRQVLLRSTEALRASEERWRAIFENSAVGIALTNAEGFFIATNRACQEMLGYTEAKLRALTNTDITYEEDRSPNRDSAGDMLWAGKRRQFTMEKRYRRKDGRLIWVRSTVSLVSGTGTVPPFGMSIIEDITERKRAEEALRSSQLMFEKLFDSSPDAIVASDRQGRIARVSEQVEKIFGYRRADLLGQPVEILVPQLFRHVHSAHREDYYARPRVRPMGEGLELYGRRADGTEFPVDILLNPIETEEGPLVLSVIRDITERKQAEERLRRSEAYLAESQRLSHIGSWAVTTSPREVVFWSAENCRIWGFDPANALPLLDPMLGRIHPEDRAAVDEEYERAIRERRDFVFDFRIALPDGTTKFCHSIGHPVLNQRGEVVEMTGTFMDATESKRSEEERQRAFDQLRALTAQLQSVREEERTRVAREIHDELGQALTAIKLDVTALVRELPADQGPPIQRSQSILKLLDETIQSVQRISTDLRPGILDDLGLGPALEWAAEEFEARTGTKCRITMPDEDITTDPDRATVLFRIFQETLTNVARHAKATEVSARLAKEDDHLALEVRDNGLGIGAEQLSAAGSLGILGMRERALKLGGEFTIQGVQGSGTTVKVRIPGAEPKARGVGT